MASSLGQACLRKDAKRVRLYLARKQLHASSKVAERDAFTGWTPMHCAVAGGSLGIVRMLLEHSVEDVRWLI